MSVKTDPVSPAPDHTPPLEEDAANPSVGKKFNQAWSRWFVSLREKVNVINDVVASLSDLVGGGFIVVDGGEAIPREIRGTAGRVDVTNGDGLAGDPTIDVVTGNIIAGANVTISGDTSNRLVGAGNITISSTGGGGGGSVTIPIILDNVPSIFDSDATNHLVDMPDTVNTGDLLLCIFTNDGDATVTLPSGWTLLDEGVQGTSVRCGWYYRISNGTEGGTTVDFVTSAAEHAVARVLRIQAGTFDELVAPEIIVNTGTSSTVRCVNLSVSWGVSDNLWLYSYGADDDDAPNVYPAVSDQSYFDSGTTTAAVSTGSCYYNLRAGGMGPSVFILNSSEEWVSSLIAIKPAP